MEALFNLRNNKIKIHNNDKPLMLPENAGPFEIKFENVTFGYDTRRKILRNASFTIPAGVKTAIVGPSVDNFEAGVQVLRSRKRKSVGKR